MPVVGTGGSMIRDQKIILKVQTTSYCPQKLTGVVYYFCPSNHFVVTKKNYPFSLMKN